LHRIAEKTTIAVRVVLARQPKMVERRVLMAPGAVDHGEAKERVVAMQVAKEQRGELMQAALLRSRTAPAHEEVAEGEEKKVEEATGVPRARIDFQQHQRRDKLWPPVGVARLSRGRCFV